jgi:hypothetical protein
MIAMLSKYLRQRSGRGEVERTVLGFIQTRRLYCLLIWSATACESHTDSRAKLRSDAYNPEYYRQIQQSMHNSSRSCSQLLRVRRVLDEVSCKTKVGVSDWQQCWKLPRMFFGDG